MKPYALIVIGNLEQARKYKQAMEAAGLLVQYAVTAARAQVQLTFTNPDLIVLDMHLPDIPGEVVLRQVRASRRLAEVPLILLAVGHQPMQAEHHTYILNPSVKAEDLAQLAVELSQKSLHV